MKYVADLLIWVHPANCWDQHKEPGWLLQGLRNGAYQSQIHNVSSVHVKDYVYKLSYQECSGNILHMVFIFFTEVFG